MYEVVKNRAARVISSPKPERISSMDEFGSYFVGRGVVLVTIGILCGLLP